MARILISSFSNVGWVPGGHYDTFVVGLMKALKRLGNNILAVRCNDFLSSEHAGLKPSVHRAKLVQAVRDFSPELIITFNNMFPSPEFITETDCPIFIYPADGYDFFKFKHLIDRHLERYLFLYVNVDNYNTYKENIPSLKDGQLCKFSYATDFKARELERDLPLSFLGSIPNYTDDLGAYFAQWPVDRAAEGNDIKAEFFKELNRFRQAPYSKFDYDLPEFNPVGPPISPETTAVFLITTRQRFKILSSLTDMDMSIYGVPSFCRSVIYDYELTRAFNYEPCVTVEQVETLYNRSKISLNLPNVRATRGFSWRVPDIMATNSCLLSFFSPDLADLMRGYIDLPMYESVAEARELAEKLLKDESWRLDLVAACRRMIDDKCRFEPNFKCMEEISGTTLHSGEPGDIKDLLVSESKFSKTITMARVWKNCKRETIKLLPYAIAKKMLD